MNPYLSGAIDGLSNVFTWPGILIPIIGTLISMTSAFLPGIGSSSLVAIVLILTLSWDPISVLLLFGALTGGATFMGSITAILFNIPGGNQSSATLIDGYPLGERGYPQTAIACAATASAVGSVFGVVVLMMLLPIIRPFLLAFGTFEMLLLGVWGLTTLVAIPNSSPIKGLAMCLLGFLVGMIGSDPVSGEARWSFGSTTLFQGLSLIPIMLGIFTFAELIGWARRYDLPPAKISGRAHDDTTWKGVIAVFKNWSLTLRSSVIGTVVGIIPGVGGTVASFVAYGQAVATTKEKDAEFGKGDIRGVVAPEASNDAKDGGSILPVVAFGIPGSESGVILLIVFSIHGILPGIPMLSDQLSLTYTLIFALLFSNILTSIVGVGLAPYLARLKDLRIDLIVLPVLLISAMAIVQLEGLYTDLITAVIFGIFGYFLRKYDWPRVPFVIALVLGSFLETNLSISVRLIDLGRVDPFERPASIGIMVMIAASLWWMLRRRTREQKVMAKAEDFPIAITLSVVLSAMAWLALFDAEPYSTTTLAVVFSAAFVTLTIAVLAWRNGGRTLRLPINPSHQIPLLTLLVLPCAVVGFGMEIGFAVTVFFWQIAMSEKSYSATLKAAVLSSLIGLVTFIYVGPLMDLYLPEPLVSKIFS
ncbi:MAG: tripartite tricarboxylate transporter permease [Pseudomonadota bacterium]